MSGLATRLLAAKRVASELVAMGSPLSAVIKGNEGWYYFGALGPALGDFIPSEKPEAFGDPGRTPYFSLWVQILKIAVGDSSVGLPGVVPTLRTFREVLDKTKAAVAAQDEGELKDLRDSGKLDSVEDAGNDLGKILEYFRDIERLLQLGTLMGSASRPKINDENQVIPEQLWTGRDWLHWKGTGKFAAELLKKAEESGAAHLKAYALGWQVSFATLLCSSGFINSAVGSSYRTHWWRHRWVCNFIDTWIWGFYDKQGKSRGADPSGPYKEWASLCDADLHKWIDVTGGALNYTDMASTMATDGTLPKPLSADFTDYWLGAWKEAYGQVMPALFTADRLQTAYAALNIVLWFQTSGAVIGCNTYPGDPPKACGSDPKPPDWIDPTQTNPMTGEPFQPPIPQPENDPDVAKIISGVVLALLGLGALYFGGSAVGAGALAGGIALIADGAVEPDWNKLECDLYWIDIYLHSGLVALHNLTVFGGVQHPYPADLDVDELMLAFGDSALPFASGPAVVRSRDIEGMRKPWSGIVSTWAHYPTESLEHPLTDVWNMRRDMWPSTFFDDLTKNPVAFDLRNSPGIWPGGIKDNFGPAVQNALTLLLNPPDSLPNWNLDGDRGRGWLTWKLTSPYTTPVTPSQEP